MPLQVDYSVMGLCKTKAKDYYPLQDACEGNWTWNKHDKSHEVKLHGKVCTHLFTLNVLEGNPYIAPEYLAYIPVSYRDAHRIPSNPTLKVVYP